MQVSGAGAGLGFLADLMFRTFPIGTGLGAFAKNLFNLDGQDMGRAYDAKRATQGGGQTFDFGDLKGMFRGLFGDLFGPTEDTSTWRGSQDGPMHPPGTPSSHARQQASDPPRNDEDIQREAQIGAGPGWKKALLYGGAALAGLTLVSRMMTRFPMPGMGGPFGMPFYGAGLGLPLPFPFVM